MVFAWKAATGEVEGQEMTEPWGRLHLDVVDDEIIITLPFTAYTVTYYKPANSPQLLAKNFPIEDNHRVPLTQAEFLARVEACQRHGARAGVDRVREAGVEAARPDLGRVLINRQPNADLDVPPDFRYCG